MSYLSLLALALKRLRARWVLSLLGLVGMTLTIALVTSIPVFTDSVGFGILQQELAAFSFGNASPPIAIRYYRVPSAPERMTVQQALETGEWLGQLTAQEVGIPVDRGYIQIGSHALTMRAPEGDERYKSRDLRQVRINTVPGVADQITIVEGQPFKSANSSSELLLWARPEFLDTLGVKVGEQFELFNFNAVHPEIPLTFRIAGTWEAKDPLGSFWYRDPHDLMAEEFLTSLTAFATHIAPYMPQQVDFTYWYMVLDQKQLRFDDVDQYTRGLQIAASKATGMLDSISVDRSPVEPLLDVQSRTRVLKELLYGFSLPIVALLLFFVGTISAITVRYQRNETAILMSRGAGRLQVLLVGLLEGAIQIAIGVPIGVLTCSWLANLMSRNSSFLSFDRQPLPVAIHSLDWRTVAFASAIALLARLAPTFRATGRTIVTHGRERARTSRTNQALSLVLDIVLVAATAYAYQQLSNRGTLSAISWEPEGVVRRDPLLYLAPTLFIVTSGWLLSEIFPLLMRLPDLIGGFLPGTSLYLGFRNLARESGAYSAPLFLLTLCLCLGSFEASIAKSADAWLVDRIRYAVGSDYSFAQAELTDGDEAGLGADAWLLPVAEYERLPGVLHAARVGVYTAVPTVGGTRKMALLGVDRLDLPSVAYWRADYASDTLGGLMNKMGAQQDGVLLTQRYLDNTSLYIGDRIQLEVILDNGVMNIPFVIAGTVYHFPTIFEGRDTVAIANLDYLFDQIGTPEPHSIWLRTVPDLDEQTLRDGLKAMRVVTADEQNAWELIKEDLAKLERVGVFGNLTVGFLSGTLVAWLGLLIYTVASLTGRLRRFTVLRAIGLRLGQVLTTVSIEYLFVIVYDIVGGAAAGIATSQLFVPYFQFTEDPAVQVPPFLPEIAFEQIAWIALAYFGFLAVAEVIVLLRATRREAFQALRIGDEE